MGRKPTPASHLNKRPLNGDRLGALSGREGRQADLQGHCALRSPCSSSHNSLHETCREAARLWLFQEAYGADSARRMHTSPLIPCSIPCRQRICSGERFAADCLHRHLISISDLYGVRDSRSFLRRRTEVLATAKRAFVLTRLASAVVESRPAAFGRGGRMTEACSVGADVCLAANPVVPSGGAGTGKQTVVWPSVRCSLSTRSPRGPAPGCRSLGPIEHRHPDGLDPSTVPSQLLYELARNCRQ